MNSEAPSWQSTFFSITGIIGFLADAITLISFISEMAGNVTLSTPPTLPSLNLGPVHLEWADLTLIILIYVGIAFAIASILPKKYSNINTVFRFHLFTALVLLWLMLFNPFGDTQLYLRIASAWMVGLIILVGLRAYNARPGPPKTPHEQMEERLYGKKQEPLSEAAIPFFGICVVALLIFIPIWAFVEKVIGNLAWGNAFAVASGWGLGGLASVLVLWTVISFIMPLVWFAFSEIFRRNT